LLGDVRRLHPIRVHPLDIGRPPHHGRLPAFVFAGRRRSPDALTLSFQHVCPLELSDPAEKGFTLANGSFDTMIHPPASRVRSFLAQRGLKKGDLSKFVRRP
jgi:hypothetical protein